MSGEEFLLPCYEQHNVEGERLKARDKYSLLVRHEEIACNEG